MLTLPASSGREAVDVEAVEGAEPARVVEGEGGEEGHAADLTIREAGRRPERSGGSETTGTLILLG